MKEIMVVGGIFISLAPAIYGLELVFKDKHPIGFLLVVAWYPLFRWLAQKLHNKNIIRKQISMPCGITVVIAFAYALYSKYA